MDGKLTMTIGKKIEQKKLLHQLWLTFQLFDSKSSCVHHPMPVFFFLFVVAAQLAQSSMRIFSQNLAIFKI
jgi:hypothetical protein